MIFYLNTNVIKTYKDITSFSKEELSSENSLFYKCYKDELFFISLK